ncbi:DoxX family protein [Mucilaginibacter lacusdianchii]|uniref:DoxX family protein n=1 Tax=Mucilaginibacter lacusdianchii TaxID=2684211 RepID=UPI00131A75C2|nr:MauE/DoxX family redox-associated membrane protein [Mucilaginibacter sp. JXJ CY 39]
MTILKRISLLILIIGYIAAGINHFIHPVGYIRIIPDYLPFHYTLNILAGVCEVMFGLMLIFKPTRKWGAWLIVLMLATFLPVHITMLLQAPMQLGSIKVTPFVAWIRLLLQPVLMLWAWWHTKPDYR